MAKIPLIEPRWFAFVSKIDTTSSPSGCWLWTGAVSKKGYGSMGVEVGKVGSAHCFSYEKFVGPISDGLVIDHLCRVRNCVNPLHLEAVTGQENQDRGFKNQNTQKVTCPKGHPYDAKQGRSDWRRCRQCQNEYRRIWRMKRKLAGLNAS